MQPSGNRKNLSTLRGILCVAITVNLYIKWNNLKYNSDLTLHQSLSDLKSLIGNYLLVWFFTSQRMTFYSMKYDFDVSHCRRLFCLVLKPVFTSTFPSPPPLKKWLFIQWNIILMPATVEDRFLRWGFSNLK